MGLASEMIPSDLSRVSSRGQVAGVKVITSMRYLLVMKVFDSGEYLEHDILRFSLAESV